MDGNLWKVKFNPEAPPPRTSSTEEMVALNLMPLDAYLSEAFDAKTWPLHNDLIIMNDLIDAIGNRFGKVSSIKLSHIFKRWGAVNLGPKRMPDKSKPKIWAIRDKVKYTEMTEGELAKEYEKPGDPNGTSTTY